MKSVLFSFFLSFISLWTFAQCPDTSIWNFDTDLECWTLTQNLEGSVVDGVLQLNVTGHDPFMHSPTLTMDALEHKLSYLEMRNNSDDISGQVYFTSNTGGWSQELSRSFDIVPNDTIIREYAIDMTIVPSWTGTITQVRMDPLATVSSGSIEIDYIRIPGLNCMKQEIGFPAVENKTIYDGPFLLEATTTSGLPVEYSLETGPAVLDGAEVTLNGEEGLVVIRASQEGDELWCRATDMKVAFVVNDTITVAEEDPCHFTDHWVGTDALGRSLPLVGETGTRREDKLVGVFYYIWMGTHGQQVKDITELLKKPKAERDWGPVGSFHFWGEPEQGYFRSEDPWVLRRDLQMLTNAGVDFLFFDVTNAVLYLDVVEEFCRVSSQMREEGIPTPDFCFTTNARSGSTMNRLFNQFYSKGEYRDLWFFWDGKPLILGHEDDPELLPYVKDFFRIKYSWAWTNASEEPDHWQWLDRYPQDYGWSEAPGIPEQISVSVAHHPSNPLGKSYHGGSQPAVNEHYVTEYTGHGLQFAEQWSRALEVDPRIVMITQWNEWIAQRSLWESTSDTYGGRPIAQGDSYFVDVFSREFNRDIAPMKDGYTDNYYYQMIDGIRRFKGMEEALEFSDPATMHTDGDFAEWENVSPAFEDPVGDVMHRNFRGYEAGSMFVNTSGRNDIRYSKVTHDADSLYFYVECSDDLSPSSDTLWMLLLLDTDRNGYTGWEGYDFMVRNIPSDPGTAALASWNGKRWQVAATLMPAVSGNRMEFALSRSGLHLDQASPEFYFKWADNPVQMDDISCFFMNGDAAPDRRFKYHFGSSVPEVVEQSAFKDHQVPGILQFEDFDQGSAGLAWVDADLLNRGGAYRPEGGVDIAGHGDQEFHVGWLNPGEWLEYTLQVNSIGVFDLEFRYASGNGKLKALLEVDGKPVSDTLVLPATGGEEKWGGYSTSCRMNAGEHVLGIRILDAGDTDRLDYMVISESDVVYPGEGSGLMRSFWTAKAGGRGWFVDSICGELDPLPDHLWSGSPGCDLPGDFWNARWEGQLEPLYTGTHHFYFTLKDLAKLWIGHELVIDGWKSGSSGQTLECEVDLQAGVKVPVRIDLADGAGDALMRLEWECGGNPREVIPTSQLFPEIIPLPTGTDLRSMESIEIWPNPATHLVHISGLSEKEIESICLLDHSGRIIQQEETRGMDTMSLPLDPYPAGVYLIRFSSRQGTCIKKLMLQPR